MKIALPLSLNLPSMGLRLSMVIERCRLVSRSEYLISAGIRKNSPNGSIHPDSLTKKFVAARKLTGINFSENPPPFHEIRSLSGRLYKDAYGEGFAQKLLGHTSENTTKIYLDGRDEKAYMMLCFSVLKMLNQVLSWYKEKRPNTEIRTYFGPFCV
ncbi:tyrosine-type recombinase/integrase [Salmonella enterica]|nr:tyrosine-type recombinase/integrase [Salmonella enterica]